MTSPLEAVRTPLDGDAAPPRDNGELVFQAPWEARAFALVLAVVDRLNIPWGEFRRQLIEAIRADPRRSYYESWTAALEVLVVARGLSDAAAIDAATPGQRAPL